MGESRNDTAGSNQASKSEKRSKKSEQTLSPNNFNLPSAFENKVTINDRSYDSLQENLFNPCTTSLSFQTTEKSFTNNFYDTSMNTFDTNFSENSFSKNNFGKNNFGKNNFGKNNFNSLPNDTGLGFSMQTNDLSDIFAEKDNHKDSGHCEEFDEVDIANIKNFLGNY